jgi:hypothetical protein
VLAHEWVKADGVASDEPLEPEVLKRMRGFAAMNKLKKEALKVRQGAAGAGGGDGGAEGLLGGVPQARPVERALPGRRAAWLAAA